MTRSSKLFLGGAIALSATLAALYATASSGNTYSAMRFLAADTADEVQTEFNNFISKHSRNYNSEGEYHSRLVTFRRNHKLIKEHNVTEKGYTIGFTKFADWTEEELDKIRNHKFNETMPQNGTNENEGHHNGGRGLQSVPASVDWRASGAVTSIKNQGSCSSCYSFSAAGAVEGAYKIKSGKLVDMSVQQLVDCTYTWRNAGCGGGYMTNCFNYLQSNLLMTSASYPYTGVLASCKYNAANGITKISSYSTIASNNPTAMQAALA